MPDLYIISADAALRGAIAEQLKIASTGGTQAVEMAALPARMADESAVLVLDEAQADAKLIASLAALHANGKKIKIFLLGETKEDFLAASDAFGIESFAKPFRLGYLLARLQFHLQAPRKDGEPLAFGPFRLEPALRQVKNAETGTVIRLTEKETQLLEYLGRSAEPVMREELLAAIWGYDARIDTHTLETHIYRLRRKLDPEGREPDMLTVQQGAYRLMQAR